MHRTTSIMLLTLLAVICVVLWPTIGSAEIILTTAIGGGADTYLSNDTQSSSYYETAVHGTNTSMLGRIYDATRMRMPYMKFDISSATGKDLTGAYVTLYELSSANRARTWNVYGLNDGVGDLWAEGTTSYDDAPGILQPANGGAAYQSGSYTLDLSQVTLLTTISLVSGIPASVSSVSSSAMDSFLAADTNGLATLILVAQASDSTASYSFASKENTSGYAFPTLTLPVAVPEPTTLSMLAACGLLALIMLRKRSV